MQSDWTFGFLDFLGHAILPMPKSLTGQMPTFDRSKRKRLDAEDFTEPCQRFCQVFVISSLAKRAVKSRLLEYLTSRIEAKINLIKFVI